MSNSQQNNLTPPVKKELTKNEKIINLVHSHPGGGAGTMGQEGVQPCSLVLENEGKTRRDRDSDGISRMYINIDILKKILTEYGYTNLDNLTAENFDKRCNDGEFAKLTSTNCGGAYLGIYACDKISTKLVQEISEHNQNGLRENGEKVRNYPPNDEQNKKLETHISFTNLAETGEPVILEGTFDSRKNLQKALEATGLRYTSTFIIGPKAEEIAMRMVGRDETGIKPEYKNPKEKSKEMESFINTLTDLYRTEKEPKPTDENGVKDWAIKKVENNPQLLELVKSFMAKDEKTRENKDWKNLVNVIGRAVCSGEVERNKILDNYEPSEGVLAFNLNGEFNPVKKEIFGDSTDTLPWVRHLGRNLDNKEKLLKKYETPPVEKPVLTNREKLDLNREVVKIKQETRQEITNWAKLQAQDETAVWRKNLSSLLKAKEYGRIHDYEKDFARLEKAYKGRRLHLLENSRPRIILPEFEIVKEKSEKHFAVELARGFAKIKLENQENQNVEKKPVPEVKNNEEEAVGESTSESFLSRSLAMGFDNRNFETLKAALIKETNKSIELNNNPFSSVTLTLLDNLQNLNGLKNLEKSLEEGSGEKLRIGLEIRKNIDKHLQKISESRVEKQQEQRQGIKERTPKIY